MIVTDRCCVKRKTQIITELARIHERLCTLLEKEFDWEDATYEAEEVLTCMGFKLEFSPEKTIEEVQLCDIVTSELMCIIDKISEEIEDDDLVIHYNKKYHDNDKYELKLIG